MALIPASSGSPKPSDGKDEKDILIADLRYIIEEQRKTIEQNNAKIAELEDDNTRKAETIRSQEARIRELEEQQTAAAEPQDETRQEKRAARKGKKSEKA